MRIMLVTHWCFDSCKVVLILSQGFFSISCSVNEELHKKSGDSIVCTADPNWPKEYFTS